MAYIIFATQQQAEEYQAASDAALGYPEQENQFEFQGQPPHSDWQLGRAMHYAPIETCQFGNRWALPQTEITVPSGATVVEALPEDWRAPIEEIGL